MLIPELPRMLSFPYLQKIKRLVSKMEICPTRASRLNEHFISYLKNQNCDVNELKEMISKGADVNYRDSSFNTPLHIVLQHCRDKFDLVHVLLAAGTHPNACNIREKVALHFAIMYCNDVQVIRELITHGAFVNLKDRNKNSPLHLAVKNNKKMFVEVLIQFGADVNLKNAKGETPLMCAVKDDNLELVKILLVSGASVSIADQNVSSPLHAAVKNTNSNLKILIELMKYNANMYSMDIHLRFPLEYAIQKYDEDPSDKLLSAKILLKCGVLQSSRGMEMLSLFDHFKKYDIYPQLIAFCAQCTQEAKQMKSEFIHQNFSFFDFALEGFECKALFQNTTPYKDLAINQILHASRNYPIYSDIIAYRLEKMILRLKSMELCVYAWKECSEREQIFLTHDEVFILTKYLCNEDILNFITAFSDSKQFAIDDFGFQSLALGKSSKRKFNEN